jgi:DNA-binding NarL/FixJ family response regulator/DNA-binding XRE family transcriptional regulator
VTSSPDPAGRVRALRLRLALTQEELGRRLGVSFVTVNRWESGRSRPSAAAERRLAWLSTGSPPTFLTSFVGRLRELEELAACPARLVTLTGPSGIGKTRLAAAFAVGSGVLSIGLGEPATAAELVLLDVGGSPSEQAIPRVRELLATPGVGRILVTARYPLALSGELVRPVPPLDDADSQELLRERAVTRPSGFPVDPRTVEALCAASGGVPAALEALASWTTTLTLHQVLIRHTAILDEGLCLATTEGLAMLDPVSRECLQMLGTFPGRFTVEAAAAVTGRGDDLDLVRALRTLVEAGWLATSAGGYLLAAPWRRLVLAGLEPEAVTLVRGRHRRHILTGPGSLTRRQAEVLACLAEGASNREIAERLHLSHGTVERHLATAYAKLGLRNRVEAARYAMQHGLMSPLGDRAP